MTGFQEFRNEKEKGALKGVVSPFTKLQDVNKKSV